MTVPITDLERHGRMLVNKDPFVKDLVEVLVLCAQKLWITETKADPDLEPSFEVIQAIELLRTFENDSGIWPGAGLISLFDSHYRGMNK